MNWIIAFEEHQSRWYSIIGSNISIWRSRQHIKGCYYSLPNRRWWRQGLSEDTPSPTSCRSSNKSCPEWCQCRTCPPINEIDDSISNWIIIIIILNITQGQKSYLQVSRKISLTAVGQLKDNLGDFWTTFQLISCYVGLHCDDIGHVKVYERNRYEQMVLTILTNIVSIYDAKYTHLWNSIKGNSILYKLKQY